MLIGLRNSLSDTYTKWREETFPARVVLLSFYIFVFLFSSTISLFGLAIAAAALYKISTSIMMYPLMSGVVLSCLVVLVSIAYFGGRKDD